MPVSFLSKEPEIEDYWRGIILFGRNVASYKFALAKSLLEIKPSSGSLVKIDDLAPIYAKHICDHLGKSDKQSTSNSSKFLDECRRYNQSLQKDNNALIEAAVRYGFNNVIDAFHIVGRNEVPSRFFTDERVKNKGIRITDNFSELLSRYQADNLPNEVEARWSLVEAAWELGVSRSLVSIGYDELNQSFYAKDYNLRRKSVTGSRGALSGYQKGKCFYCFGNISIESEEKLEYPDVDHFFPHVLKQQGFSNIIDGIWNLVLSCQSCNRGSAGKFASVPSVKLLARLHRRNEFLISSHHPLRETLIMQTGSSEQVRISFLNKFHEKAQSALVQPLWNAKELAAPFF
jgi:hypothetical protein